MTLCAYTPQDSALWHIFVSPLAIGKSNALLITYTLTAFVVLAYQLLRDIGSQTRAVVRAFAQARDGLWIWRF